MNMAIGIVIGLVIGVVIGVLIINAVLKDIGIDKFEKRWGKR